MMFGAVLFALLIQPLVSAEESTNSVVYTVQSTYQVSNASSTTATDVLATIYIFDNRSGWASQQVLSENIQLSDPFTDNYEIVSPGEDNRLLRVSLHTISGGATKTITVSQVIKVDYVDLQVSPSTVQGDIPPDLLQLYTQPVAHLWESDNPTLANKALELTQNQTNLYNKAEAIYNFVKGYLTYQEQTAEHSALWAYNSRIGDCTEFTNLFIALCRAAGIPAKFVSGYLYDTTKGGNLLAMGHAFAFIYLPNADWVPVEVTGEGTKFCELNNDHLVLLTNDGGDLVDGAQVKIPGDLIEYYGGPVGAPQQSATITREVAVEAEPDAVGNIEDGKWRWTVTVTNSGTQAVQNLSVELQVDETYFETPAAQNITSLASGTNQPVNFDLVVKDVTLQQGVENSQVKATVTYDCSYGTFSTQEQSSATVAPQQVTWEIDPLWIALIGVIIGLAITIAVLLVRR